MSVKTITAPLPGILSRILVSEGDSFQKGDTLATIEVMKMESAIQATSGGIVTEIRAKAGEVVEEGHVIMKVGPLKDQATTSSNKEESKGIAVRKDLQELFDRKVLGQDSSRPEKVAKRKKRGGRTAWENVLDLCDEDSFKEYGSLIVAAQRSRRDIEDLMINTAADGIITGVGSVNGHLFEEEFSRCMVLCYDFTVLAGTQGAFGHKKTDRMLHLAKSSKLPIILFAEGGGGRPGDTDFDLVSIGGLDIMTFNLFASLNGLVQRVAIVAGYCFAGNAALAGCSDVIIATTNTSMGMGGPAMIEGGGLGTFHPKDVGPATVQYQNGVIDILVNNEQEAVFMAQKYLSYFQGKTNNWECEDQEKLRDVVPENRRRIYDIRKVIQLIADKDSVLELRKGYAPGMITSFIRVEGHPLGLLANNPSHLGGAIDSDAADKATRFMQLCNAFGIPIISLCDTPGFMVGPEAEKSGTVRHASRLFTTGASLRIPVFAIVLRKAYGLGSMAMVGGSMHVPFFTVSWPTGEFGGMGLEGAVKLGFRKELEAIGDPEAREKEYERLVEKAYQHGKALNAASYLEIDEVIDPKDSREWILMGIRANPRSGYAQEGQRFWVDCF